MTRSSHSELAGVLRVASRSESRLSMAVERWEQVDSMVSNRFVDGGGVLDAGCLEV
jgi:hypothetical protein